MSNNDRTRMKAMEAAEAGDLERICLTIEVCTVYPTGYMPSVRKLLIIMAKFRYTDFTHFCE